MKIVLDVTWQQKQVILAAMNYLKGAVKPEDTVATLLGSGTSSTWSSSDPDTKTHQEVDLIIKQLV